MVLDWLLWPALLRLNGVDYGPSLSLVGRPDIRTSRGGKITMGTGVRLFSRRRSSAMQLTGPCTFVLLQPSATISVAAESALSGVRLIAAKSIRIGERVLIGPNTIIIDTDAHPLSPEVRRDDRNRGATQPIVIGNDVFVGAHVIILKGTELGDGCVVGAGSVVCGQFPPRSVIVGNPARVARQLGSDAVPGIGPSIRPNVPIESDKSANENE
jgi:hypothetical protein